MNQSPREKIEKVEALRLGLLAFAIVAVFGCIGICTGVLIATGSLSKDNFSGHGWMILIAPLWLPFLLVSMYAVLLWARHKKFTITKEAEDESAGHLFEKMFKLFQKWALEESGGQGSRVALAEAFFDFEPLVRFAMSSSAYIPYFDLLCSRVIIPHELIIEGWFLAAKRGDVKVMRHLLENGLIVEGENPKFQKAGGYTAAQVAALNGKVEVIAYLREVGLCTSLDDILPLPPQEQTAAIKEELAVPEPLSIPVVVIEGSTSEPAVQVPASEPSPDTGNPPSPDTGD